ncbi:hypothetical protein Dsin_017204 [Dipteronia sinensis]|uniref:Uncharacterized protein n=1 Tax=Dipteronia sinensis TaxID=43782 RepID=A0AAE0E7N4_9ROSI|nr:hypothetical protein Dsin_017204 [Dipteronia sinensis]
MIMIVMKAVMEAGMMIRMVMKEKEIMAIGMMISMAEMETHIVVGETMKTAMAAMVTEMMIPMEKAVVLIITKIAQAGTPIDTVLLVMTVNHHVEAVEPELTIIMLKEVQAKQLMLLPLGTTSPVNQEVVTSDDFDPHGSAPGPKCSIKLNFPISFHFGKALQESVDMA